MATLSSLLMAASAAIILLLVGLALLLGYVFLARAYWFRIPLRGITASTLLYLAALAVNQTSIGGFQ